MVKVSTIRKFGMEFTLYESDDVQDWLDMFYKSGKYKGENICWDDLKDGTGFDFRMGINLFIANEYIDNYNRTGVWQK